MTSVTVAPRRGRRQERILLPLNPPRFILRLLRLSIPLQAGRYIPTCVEHATPSLNARSAQGSVRPLSLPAPSRDLLWRRRSFERRAGLLNIKTCVEQDDAGTTSFELRRQDDSDLLSLSAGRCHDEEHASYDVELSPRWGQMTLGRESSVIRVGVRYNLNEDVQITANTTADLNPKTECALRGEAGYSSSLRSGTIGGGLNGNWEIEANPFDNVHMDIAQNDSPSFSMRGHKISWMDGWPALRVKLPFGKFRVSNGKVGFDTIDWQLRVSNDRVEVDGMDWRATVKKNGISGELRRDGDLIKTKLGLDGVRIEARKERHAKNGLKCRASARVDTRRGVALRFGWFF